MNRVLHSLPYSLALLGVAFIVLTAFNSWLLGSPTRNEPVSAPAQSWTSTDFLLERLQERLRGYPADQEAYLNLGAAYLQKARETGEASYYARAEEAFRKTLELNPNHPGAMSGMGALAVTRHQFREALEWANRSLALKPEDADTYGVRGDAQVELGMYQAAIQSFQTMVDLKPNLNSYARVSYIRELMGDTDGAIEAMRLAVAAGPPGTETAAWTRAQLGSLYFNAGRIDDAEKQYQAALTDFNNYYPALAGLGKVRAAQGNYHEAIQLYQQAVAIIPQPGYLAALGDLYAETGRPDQARLQYDTVEVVARLAASNQQAYNRELALFYADHDIKLEEALDLASREIEARQDIYGYDTLAWALFKNGRITEAAHAIAEAMKLGTQDASIYYHAGMIHYQMGDEEQAYQYLQQALELNPHFSVRRADDAQRTLEELESKLASAGMVGGTTP